MPARSKVFGARWTSNFATQDSVALIAGEYHLVLWCWHYVLYGVGPPSAVLKQQMLDYLTLSSNRSSCRLHPAHTHLWSLASGPHRERYEELRAVYNMVRPEGSKAAPPYEDWTGISDVCDHTGVFCRYVCEFSSRSWRAVSGSRSVPCRRRTC